MNSNEEVWTSIVTALKAASQAGMWAFWRERFNTNHPDFVRQQEVDNPMRFAEANWFAAKHVYCVHKESMDKYCDLLIRSHDVYPGVSAEVELFLAMKKTIDKEVDEQIDNLLTEEETMGRKNYEEPELLDEMIDDEEYDEDEEYLRELEEQEDRDLWDGDDYLGDDEEE